jgi:hypothetical protein
MLPQLLILFSGLVVGFNCGVIVYAVCLARSRRRPAPPPRPDIHIVTTGALPHQDAQRIAAHWRLQ